jgi:putative nucleotidyltransferase with HDIG domain
LIFVLLRTELRGQTSVGGAPAVKHELPSRARSDQTLAELASAYDTTIERWAQALELRNDEPENHCMRVTEMTLQLGRALGISEEELADIRRGAFLHDIGKMAIPDSILLKNGPLTVEERAVMERHTEVARRLLAGIPYLERAMDIPTITTKNVTAAGTGVDAAIPLAGALWWTWMPT